MKLTDWMSKKHLQDAEIATRLGLSRAYVTKLRLGHAIPSLQVAADVARISDGAVGLNDWPLSAGGPAEAA